MLSAITLLYRCTVFTSAYPRVKYNAITLCSGRSKQFMKVIEVNEMVKLWDIKLTFGLLTFLSHPCPTMFVFFSFD